MFNTLASYLLGNSNSVNVNPSTSTNSTNENNRESGEVPDKSIDDFNRNLTTTVCDEDDDWLLVVEKSEEESLPRTDSEEELPFIDIKNSPLTRSERAQHATNTINTTDNHYRNVALYCPPARNSMEESWFVTPPPCFTSTGPVNMETSPLENLLIEHPSMSVYRFARTSTHQEIDEDMVVLDFSEAVLIENSPANERTSVHTTRVANRQSERATRTRSDRGQRVTDEQTKQIVLARNGQKSLDKKVRQVLGRGAMERSNKVREINSNRTQKRSDMYNSRLASRANNNRKC